MYRNVFYGVSPTNYVLPESETPEQEPQAAIEQTTEG